MNIKFHAVQQFSVRTGTPILKSLSTLLKLLEKAQVISQEKAAKKYPLLHAVSGDTYLEFTIPKMNEDAIAIRRKDGAIVTVLTQSVYGYMPEFSRQRTLAHKFGKEQEKNFSEDVDKV